jgi:hypothetical protein
MGFKVTGCPVDKSSDLNSSINLLKKKKEESSILTADEFIRKYDDYKIRPSIVSFDVWIKEHFPRIFGELRDSERPNDKIEYWEIQCKQSDFIKDFFNLSLTERDKLIGKMTPEAKTLFSYVLAATAYYLEKESNDGVVTKLIEDIKRLIDLKALTDMPTERNDDETLYNYSFKVVGSEEKKLITCE